MRLRIAWAGPWNARSAIAEFGTEVVAELLSRGHIVDVLRTELDEALALPPRPTAATVGVLAAVPPAALRQDYDAVVVNLGDNHDFHGAAIETLRQVPAILVLHDAYLANLYAGWAERHPALSADVLADLYGDAAAAGPFWLPPREMAATRPMLEWFAAFGAGAVVHAQHYAERVRTACPGPVDVIPLAHRFPGLPPPPAPQPDRLMLATIGHVNANRRIEAVLQAIADSPRLRACVQYRLIGPATADERARLVAVAAALGIAPPAFTGWVTDAALREALADVDVIACLRDPVLEGGSGSLILAMRSGRPTLVSTHGAYADVPPDLLLGCPPGAEASAIRRHLEAMLDDAAPAQAMGRRARDFAERTFDTRVYVDALLELIERATAGIPAIRTARRFGGLLAEFGAAPNDAAVERVAVTLVDLLDHGQKGGTT